MAEVKQRGFIAQVILNVFSALLVMGILAIIEAVFND